MDFKKISYAGFKFAAGGRPYHGKHYLYNKRGLNVRRNSTLFGCVKELFVQVDYEPTDTPLQKPHR